MTSLGGVAFGVAKAAITKWIGKRIADGIDSALRNRQLRQGRPAKDQQAELIKVITTAVDKTAADLYPEDQTLRRQFSKSVCRGRKRDWPLVNGTDLNDLVSDVALWLAEGDPDSHTGQDRLDVEAHPYLEMLCGHIVSQFGFRAENNGMHNTILFPRWNRFCTNELFTDSELQVAETSRTSTFDNVIHGPANTVVQGEQVIINTGSGAGAGAPVSPWPLRRGTIPPLAAARQDRPVDAALATTLEESGTAVLCQILAGAGGVGKTQVAAAYAHQCWREGEVDLLLWVSADTREAVTTAFAQAGAELCGAGTEDSDRVAQDFLAWLDRPNSPRWLIVLDDLTKAADLHGLWPPANPRGRALVTTRLRETALDAHGRTRIDVGLYTPEQALRYLTERLGEHADRLDGAASLADDLGFLPLALAQAAAYLLDRPGLTCEDYRQLLSDQDRTLDQLLPQTLPEDYPRSLAAALTLSISRAEESEPGGLSAALLDLASLLNPAGIPVELFTSEPVRQYLAQSHNPATDTAAPDPVSRRVIEDALARLHRLSLIDHDGTLIRVHALTQRVSRDRSGPEARTAIAHVDADALCAIWPKIENAPAYSALLRSNTAKLRELAEPALLQPEAHPVLFHQGDSLGESGLVSEAAAHFWHLHQRCNRTLGRNHSDTFIARGNLAYWQGEAGDAAGAADAFAALLEDRVRMLGPDHPDTLTTRSNLASWRSRAGEAAGATDAFAALLNDRVRVLGPDHPDTLTTRSNLASWQGEAGDATGAADAFAALLDDHLRILGPDHPNTLATRNNLAAWRGRAGDAAGAADAFEALLEDFLRVLGPDHPDTLTTRNNLASWQGEAGDAAGAADAFAALLDDHLRILGPDHPDTLITRGNLASWRSRAGDATGATDAFAALLDDHLRILGPDHPNTFTTRGNLASWQGEAGDATGATEAFAALLDDRLRVLGPDHPDTLVTKDNLAYWRDFGNSSSES